MDDKFPDTLVFDDEQEFLKRLLSEQAHDPGRNNRTVFRGTGKTQYKLVPRLFRDMGENFPPGSSSPRHEGSLLFSLAKVESKLANHAYRENVQNVVEAERTLLDKFRATLNDQGHVILPEFKAPDDIKPFISRASFFDLPNQMPVADQSHLTRWPSDEYMPIIALAQHYGLPTRLMDWTTSPLVAAYFAAIDSIAQIDRYLLDKKDNTVQWSNKPRLCVWVYRYNISELENFQESYNQRRDYELRELYERRAYDDPHPYYRSFPVLLAPGTTGNENMRAQSGLFSVIMETTEHKFYQGNNVCYTEMIKEITDENNKILFKIELSARAAPDLAGHLHRLGFNGASMFPGPYGAVRAIEERSREWRVRNVRAV